MPDSQSKDKKEKKEDPIKVEEIVIPEKVNLEVEKEVLSDVPEETELEAQKPETTVDLSGWKPKTELGRKVKAGEITDIDEILNNGLKILEAEIVDKLLPNLESDLLMIGQSKGKFGGGQRRVFKQTQKKTNEGNKPKFATFVVIGNKNGYVGLGYGKAKETVPSREKAIRNAKLNIIKIRRGCGSWDCTCKEHHSIPFKVTGKCGSVIVNLMPAPKGTGLIVENEIKKILALAGITDVWSKTLGQTNTKTNMIMACYAALSQLVKTKIQEKDVSELNILEGVMKDIIVEDKNE